MCRAKKEENNGAAPLRSVSGEVFATFASLLLVALVLMCMLQTGLSCAYFAQERKSALTAVLDGATAMAETYASEGNIVTLPGGDNELVERAKTGFELFNTSSDALVFVADRDGNILMHTGKDVAESAKIPQNLQEEMDSGKDIFLMGTMDDTLHDKYYIAGRRVNLGGSEGYLFAATPVHALAVYIRSILTMFLLSSAVILIVCGILCMVLARRITWPIEQISQAAKRLGGGDFTARAPVTGCQELADFATTFNNMAGRLQNIDNSRGQFMGNIAHELRTPMTTIKGFVDGILDGTIPPEMQNHYLQLVSEETGRLARLIQNMLDLSKLESGEYQVNARMFNIWETLTGVALAAEQRINDGMIELEGLTMDEKVLVYADPDLIHQVAYNLLDNAIKFTPAGGTIRFSVEKLGPEAEISIWNSGQGISPEALPYVFERFYKEDRSRGLHARGSGLGLNICKVLVNLSGGQIRVESQQGEWCRFVFTLPTCSPNPGGMKRLPDAAGQPGAVEDPASMKPVE